MPPEPEKLTEEDLIALARLEGKPMPEHLKAKVLEDIRMTPEKEKEKDLTRFFDELEKDAPENDAPEF